MIPVTGEAQIDYPSEVPSLRKNGRSHAIESRLRFVDFLVAQYGYIRRSALCDFFGISLPQASSDIGDYLTLAPGNLVYDAQGKSYVKGPNFKRVWP